MSERAPLRVVAAMMEAGQYDAVVVFSDDEEVLGVLLRDAVMRLSPRLPEAPVRLLPLQRTRALGPDFTHADAEALIEGGELDAVLVEQRGAQQWTVLLRA